MYDLRHLSHTDQHEDAARPDDWQRHPSEEVEKPGEQVQRPLALEEGGHGGVVGTPDHITCVEFFLLTLGTTECIFHQTASMNLWSLNWLCH